MIFMNIMLFCNTKNAIKSNYLFNCTPHVVHTRMHSLYYWLVAAIQNIAAKFHHKFAFKHPCYNG